MVLKRFIIDKDLIFIQSQIEINFQVSSKVMVHSKRQVERVYDNSRTGYSNKSEREILTTSKYLYQYKSSNFENFDILGEKVVFFNKKNTSFFEKKKIASRNNLNLSPISDHDHSEFKGYSSGYLLTKHEIYKVGSNCLELIVKNNEIEFSSIHCDPKRQLAFVCEEQSPILHIFNVNQISVIEAPILSVRGGYIKEPLKATMLDKNDNLFLSDLTGHVVLTNLSIIEEITLDKLANNDYLVLKSLEILQGDMTRNDLSNLDSRISKLIDKLSLHYKNSLVRETEFFYIILSHGSPKTVRKYLEVFGLSSLKDQVKDALLLTKDNADSEGKIIKNFEELLEYLAERDADYLLKYMDNGTFYDIMKWRNFENEKAADFCVRVLSSKIGEVNGEVKTSRGLIGMSRSKTEIIEVSDKKSREVQTDAIFTTNDRAIKIENHGVYSTRVKLSFDSNTSENDILFQFLGKLRDEEIPSLKVFINLKFRKIKWVHFINFLLFLPLTILLNFELLTKEKKPWIFWPAIALNLIFIGYEIITFSKLGTSNYFKLTSNFFDFLCLMSSLAVMVWSKILNGASGHVSTDFILGMASLIITFVVNVRCIFYLTFMDGFRPLIQSIQAIVMKILYFIGLMVAYAFVVVASLVAKERLDELRGLENPEDTLFSDKVYYSLKLSFGDIGFPTTNADLNDGEALPAGHDWLYWVVLIPNGLIVVIMLLNLLIGILSNGFDEFQKNFLVYDLKVKVAMIKEADAVISFFSCKLSFVLIVRRESE